MVSEEAKNIAKMILEIVEHPTPAIHPGVPPVQSGNTGEIDPQRSGSSSQV